MSTGTILSGIGHAALILWMILGDWLFQARDAPEIAVTQVSLLSADEFAALSAPVPSPPRPQARPAVVPPPVVPPPESEPEPAPEPEPQPAPQPIEVPEPIAPLAPEEQVLPSLSAAPRALPRPADRVAPEPAPAPEPEVETALDPTPATTDTPSEEPLVPPPDTAETVAPESGDVLRTEATEEQTEALGMQTSMRPRARPAAPQAVAEDEAPTEDDVAAAIAAAVSEAAAEPADAGTDAVAAPAGGEPMTQGEIGDFSRAISSKWNLGSASTDALRTTVIVRVDFSPDGQPTGIALIESDGPTEAATTTAFEAARRAVQRAALQGGIPLPRDKYETWKVVELVFDPNGMRMR